MLAQCVLCITDTLSELSGICGTHGLAADLILSEREECTMYSWDWTPGTSSSLDLSMEAAVCISVQNINDQ